MDVLNRDAEQRLLIVEKVWESLCTDPSSVPMTDAQREDHINLRLRPPRS